MNQRLSELNDQAVTYAMDVCDANGLYQGKEYLQVVREKLAELIVRECSRTLLEWKSEPFPLDPDLAAKLIRDHFGIEE